MTKSEFNKILQEHGMYVNSGSVYFLYSYRLACRYFLGKTPDGYHVLRIAYFTKAVNQETKNFFKTIGLIHGIKVGD